MSIASVTRGRTQTCVNHFLYSPTHLQNKSVNQLLIRVEKLLQDIPSDPSKRRAHEQSVVPWIDEDSVKLCPYCAKTFGLSRRKHHCRLCGSVLCSDCSTTVSLDLARQVTSPVPALLPEDDFAPKMESESAKSKFNLALLKSKMSVSPANLGALRGPSDDCFRSCQLCLDILERQLLKAQNTSQDHPIAKCFQQLQSIMNEGRCNCSLAR